MGISNKGVIAKNAIVCSFLFFWSCCRLIPLKPAIQKALMFNIVLSVELDYMHYLENELFKTSKFFINYNLQEAKYHLFQDRQRIWQIASSQITEILTFISWILS